MRVLFIYSISLCVCLCTHIKAHVWRLWDNLWGLVISLQHVYPWDCKVWWQVPLLTKPSHWPQCEAFFCLFVYVFCFFGVCLYVRVPVWSSCMAHWRFSSVTGRLQCRATVSRGLAPLCRNKLGGLGTTWELVGMAGEKIISARLLE